MNYCQYACETSASKGHVRATFARETTDGKSFNTHPLYATPIEIADNGMPCTKFVVPSMGSTIQSQFGPINAMKRQSRAYSLVDTRLLYIKN